jgi:CubicO group peptidase (beta-lactamase class C family)
VFALWVLCSLFFIIDLTRAQSNQETKSDQEVMVSEANYRSFENRLETVCQVLKIPGMSAAIVRDQELVWVSGFGYADLQNQVPATADTIYGLASVTKPVAAVLIMQLVEEGLVDLDAPISGYDVNLLGDQITVRHLMTHTSEGIPGTVHN